MSIVLKIKSKHLALEAGVIRFEENKLKKQISWHKKRQMPVSIMESKLHSLSSHRKKEVRNENRATFLARAYIAGKPYKTLEASVKDKYTLTYYILPRVASMVKKYHKYSTTLEDIVAWAKE